MCPCGVNKSIAVNATHIEKMIFVAFSIVQVGLKSRQTIWRFQSGRTFGGHMFGICDRQANHSEGGPRSPPGPA